jgi:hypothetical protein
MTIGRWVEDLWGCELASIRPCGPMPSQLGFRAFRVRYLLRQGSVHSPRLALSAANHMHGPRD